MKVLPLCSALLLASTSLANTNRQALAYAPIPAGIYTPAADDSVTTLLDFIKSRSELSVLAKIISECGGSYLSLLFLVKHFLTQPTGFTQAFETIPTWTFTFFAPSDTAFNNTGAYFSTYAATPKGKWWLGNLLQHHYIPYTQLKSSVFTTSYTRTQTGSFLYVGTQVVSGKLMLNNVSAVTSANLPVTSVSYPAWN